MRGGSWFMHYHNVRGLAEPLLKKYRKLLILVMAALFAATQFSWMLGVVGASGDDDYIKITGSTTVAENDSGKWFFNRDANTDTPYEFNYTDHKIGDGSLQILPIGANASDKFIGEYFFLKEVSKVKKFEYHYKIGGDGTAADKVHFYLNVYANFATSAPTKFYDCRYNVFPSEGSTSSWKTVTFNPNQSYDVATRTDNASTPDINEASPQPCPAKPLDMGEGATIRVFAINLGDTSTNDVGLGGWFDKVTLETKKSSRHTKKTTFDFEPISYVDKWGKIIYCHATGSEQNPFEYKRTSLFGLNGHKNHEGDIIPPNVKLPNGKNWSTENIAIWENDCEVEQTMDCNWTNNRTGAPVSQNNCFDAAITVEPCGTINGLLTGSVTNHPEWNYNVYWSETQPSGTAADWWAGANSFPHSFPEDYNGGSVDIWWWAQGTENLALAGSGLPAPDGNSKVASVGGEKLTVNTNCDGEVLAACSVSVFSDITNKVVEKDNADAKALSWTHPGWTATASIPGATWIWGDDPVADATNETVQTFKKKFGWNGAVSSAVIDIAADNDYELKVNGNIVGTGTNTYSGAHQYDISGFIEQGNNTIEVKVTNWAWNTADPKVNPAGLLYRAVVTTYNESGEGCDPPVQPDPDPETCSLNSPFGFSVKGTEQGNRKDGSGVLPSRSDKDTSLGSPDNVFYSLGFGGWIEIEFDGYVTNGIGNDLTFYEVTNGTYPEESAKVEVSQNGTDWSIEAFLVNNKGQNGIDIAPSGLAWVKYVRVTDTSNSSLFSDDADGYDLDAISANYYSCEKPDIDVLTSTVTVCKENQDGDRLEGWQLALLGEKIETLYVDSKINTAANKVISGSLPAGNYVVKASGTFKYRGGTNLIADPRFSERLPGDSNYGGPYVPWNTGNLGWLQLNDDNTVWGTVLSANHTYYASVSLGSDGVLDFFVGDDNYSDNVGSLTVEIYEGYTAITGEDGCVIFEEVPYGEYSVEELLQPDWDNLGGLGGTEVDESEETFVVVNLDPNAPEEPESPQTLTWVVDEVVLECGSTTDSNLVAPTWSPVEGALYYIYSYKAPGGDWVIDPTLYTDPTTGPTSFGTVEGIPGVWEYRVKAVFEGGVETDWSESCPITFEPKQLGQIAGLVYNDANNNSEKDEGEPGLANRTVWLITHNSPWYLRNAILTKEDGTFVFENLEFGTYYVCQDVPNGWLQTEIFAGLGGVEITAAIGSQIGEDSNPELDALIPEFCYTAVLSSENQQVENRNFGNHNPGDGQTLGVSTTNGGSGSGVLADTDTLATTGREIAPVIVISAIIAGTSASLFLRRRHSNEM